ncbi:hypothetical protein AOT31_10015 [Corynebacterium ulcerans]|nr:hypothetical protein AOT31_10015 [Corynebacterium ulcerans]
MVPILGLSFPHGSENNVIATTNFFHNATTSIYAENKIYASVGFLFQITQYKENTPTSAEDGQNKKNRR